MKLNKKFMGTLLGVLVLANTTYAAESLNCVNENNTNLVPLRTMSEEFGAKVEYIGELL